MILRNKKLFLLLKDSICEFILLSQVILLSRHSFIYIKIVQFRILQGNLSESSPFGWSVVCFNQTTKPKLFRVIVSTDEPASRHFVKTFQTRNPLLENWNSSCKYFRHSSQSTSDETQRSIQDQENSQHHPGSKNHQTQPSIFNARSSKWYLNQERIHQRSL